MAWNSFLSNFLTIVFTLFEGENTHLKVIKRPKAMCLVQRGGRRGEGVSSCFPKGVAGRGWDMRVPQVKPVLGRVLSRQSLDLLVVAVGRLQCLLGTRMHPNPHPSVPHQAPAPRDALPSRCIPEQWSSAFATEPGLFTRSTLWGKLIIFTPRSLAGVAVPLKCFLWGIYRPF